jgi:regulatory protein
LTASEAFPAALRLLSVRDMSEAELDRRLRRKGYPEAAVASAMDRCRELGYLDDARFARERSRALLRSGRAVGRRLLADLIQRGVEETVARAAVEEAETEFDPQALLADTLARRFPAFCFGEAGDREKKRVVDYFLRRGFSLAEVLTFLKEERQKKHS